ncbi:MAG TPA: hypothetical protein PLQ04_01725 [Lachnospiraceae bacterium]|nr:hypothetical protein [Lachnospiraceae bacterium]
MNRPWAYVTAAWDTNSSRAKKYCRTLYLEGYSRPFLFQKEYTNDQVAEEHKDRLDMAEEFLRRSRILVVCGKRVDDTVQNEIAVAAHFRIPSTTLEGILSVESSDEKR